MSMNLSSSLCATLLFATSVWRFLILLSICFNVFWMMSNDTREALKIIVVFDIQCKNLVSANVLFVFSSLSMNKLSEPTRIYRIGQENQRKWETLLQLSAKLDKNRSSCFEIYDAWFYLPIDVWHLIVKAEQLRELSFDCFYDVVQQSLFVVAVLCSSQLETKEVSNEQKRKWKIEH